MLVAFYNTSPVSIIRTHGNCSHGHDGNHYTARAPTTTAAGNKEFWVCCKCHEKFLTQPTGTFVNVGTAPILGIDHLAYVPRVLECTHPFDTAADVASLPTPTDSDAWCWPRAFSTEKSHDGPGSLKVTPHPSEGTWAVVNFGKYNLTNSVAKVRLWIYADSTINLENMGLMFAKGDTPAAAYTYYKSIAPRQWVLYEVATSTLTNYIDDLSNVRIFIGNVGSTYTNRCPLFLDSFDLVTLTHGFDSAADVASLPTPTDGDAWCWPRAFSTEKAHDGVGSLKITPHPTDGNWAIVDFGNYNLNNIHKIELWLYLDGSQNLDCMGLMFDHNGGSADYTYYTLLIAKQWVKYEVLTSTLASYISNLSNVRIYLGNVAGSYTNRAPLFVDSFNLVPNTG
ncbi:MAG: hypothetical protein ACOX3K_02405 [Bacilli bacterium]|jgi:hypothetical protein